MGERGGYALALVILVVGFFVIFWLVVDACNEDPGERRDLGSRELILESS